MKSPALTRSRLAWLERALLIIGLLCLAVVAYVWLDGRFYEIQQERQLEKALAAEGGQPRAPASETDSLAAFQRRGTEEEKDLKDCKDCKDERTAEEEAEKPVPARPVAEEGELVGRIEIPRIGVSAIVLEGVTSRTLRRGVGRIPGTARPVEETGNVGLAAHRDRHFRALKDIREKDVIELTTLDGKLRYEVEWTRIVKPTDTEVLAPSEEASLTLVTCYPFYYVGSAPKRFIVHARRIDEFEFEDDEEEEVADRTEEGER